VSPPVVDLNERLAARAAPPPPEPGGARVRAVIQDLARELSAQAEPIGAAIARRLLLAEERLVDHDDPALAGLATRFAHASVGANLAALAYGMPTETARPTQSSLELFEHLTERDDGLAVLLRSHRLVSAELWQAWAAFTDERVLDRRLHRAVLSLSTRELGAYSDSVCEHLTGAWPEARRRRRRGVGVPVAQLLRRAVFGPRAVAEAALAELGYPVDACHVAIALPPCVGREQLEDVARRVQLACGAPALAAPDPDGMTVWVAFGRDAAAEGLERAPVLRDLKLPVGLGGVGSGLEGFRRTRQQSADALRIALRDEAAGITRYRDVALLAVLCADETRARELARMELGPLAGDDEVAVRLRDTVRTYLAVGESQVATAQRLFVHEKTVKYRLTQAEELLGRKIGERRPELGAALMVHRAFERESSGGALAN
jgi:PucR C-terminal helix-turn-helix domain/GGDEF-like domain